MLLLLRRFPGFGELSVEGSTVVIAKERACRLPGSEWAGVGLFIMLGVGADCSPALITTTNQLEMDYEWACVCMWVCSEFVDLERNASLIWKRCLKLTYETTVLKRACRCDLKGLSTVIVFILGFLTKSWVIITEGSDCHALNFMTSIFSVVLHKERTCL